jgi:ATP-dependent DNA helicase RecQ
MSSGSLAPDLRKLREVVARYWGFKTFKPLQEPAMQAVLQGRDSLVVLPTGGGKSLCYQAPAVVRGDITVVVSPLISLMKDQVDALQANGVPAVQINSGQSPAERSAAERALAQGTVRLLFVSPERLVMPGFQQLLQQIGVRTFAIDEAHCISHWGHDFRPEYRQLSQLKTLFPAASVHAYTATATKHVRDDIVAQLALKNPEVLIGNFDRPNLIYRVLPRQDIFKQTLEVIDRHPGEAGIIYCIRRRDVDELCPALVKKGCKAMPYHAGLTPEQRHETQNAFAAEECDLVVATVAFGMGIDRSNIRFILHTGLPKSVEHYQQETGRAGRDGLEAECVLLYSPADVLLWKSIIEKSAAEPDVDPEFIASALRHLEDLDRYCRVPVCRHRALVAYFGQDYPTDSCGACDLCLGDTEEVPDALVVAQKILSCVARVKERFGIGHVISVLRGENTEKVRKFGHNRLSTFKLLEDRTKNEVRDWIYQLIGQGVLVQEQGEYPVLRLNEASWEVMRGERTIRLIQPVRGKAPRRSKADTASWEGVDRLLFEALRELRRKLAEERNVQPYIIFSDATLRELARIRPSTVEKMRLVYGVGNVKLQEYGEAFHQVIAEHCRQRGLTTDSNPQPAQPDEPRKAAPRPNPQRDSAFALFRTGMAIEDVMHRIGRARTTVVDYLCEFIRTERPASLAPWVSDSTCQRIAVAAREVGTERLKPIFVALGETVSYDEIRIVLAALAPPPARA